MKQTQKNYFLPVYIISSVPNFLSSDKLHYCLNLKMRNQCYLKFGCGVFFLNSITGSLNITVKLRLHFLITGEALT